MVSEEDASKMRMWVRGICKIVELDKVGQVMELNILSPANNAKVLT